MLYRRALEYMEYQLSYANWHIRYSGGRSHRTSKEEPGQSGRSRRSQCHSARGSGEGISKRCAQAGNSGEVLGLEDRWPRDSASLEAM
jgi:hypothetical protein